MGNLTSQSIQLGSPGRSDFIKTAFRPGSTAQLGMHHMNCEVVFGSPSANCMGTGVCKISAATTMPVPVSQGRSCQHVSAILMPFEEGNGVSLVMAREMMCIKLFRTQFKGGVLILNETCRLPEDITTRLSLKIKDLKPGIYVVEEINGFFRINFK